MKFNAEIDISKFIAWADRVIAGVQAMRETMFELSAIYEVHSRVRTPLEKGYLENSMEETIISEYPRIEMELIWSGSANPRARGYDYAYFQNIMDVNHPLRPVGKQSAHFVETGATNSFGSIIAEIETDYLSALGGKDL